MSTKHYSDTARKAFAEDLNTPFPITKEAIDFFREYGYVKLKNVLAKDTLHYYGDIITELVFKLNTLTKPWEERTTYERAFLQIFNLW